MLFDKRYSVGPNQMGYLFRANVLDRELSPGIYHISDWRNQTMLVNLPVTARTVQVVNQEILSKDNIAFRVSFYGEYRITNGTRFLTQFELNRDIQYVLSEFEQRLYNLIQLQMRLVLSTLESETVNEQRMAIGNLDLTSLNEAMQSYGVEVSFVQLRDITFPKSIQDLFAKHLEAKVRSRSELENARTAVATARALRNAAELMKDNDDIKFIQYVDLLAKIADKGKHTFIIGDGNPSVPTVR